MTFRQFACNNVIRNKRTYAAYFLSSAFSVMVFFIYAMFIFHPGLESATLRELVVTGMKAAEYIIYVFSFFFILYSVGAFLKSRKKEFGILMMHGMSPGQLNLLVFMENMLIGIASIATGIALGLVCAKLVLLIGSSILDVKELPFYFAWKAMLSTIGAFFFLFLVISVCTTFFVRGNRVIDLLQGSAKPKREPKASILLSLFAFGLLATGYYLAATTTSENIGIRMLPVIFIVILGTYFFFTQLSVFAIRLLKKNRTLFWRKTNLIMLSDLSYRIKDNARMFFLVTIVSTVAFCAVGTLASTGTLESQVKERTPFAFNYVVASENLGMSKWQARIEQGLKQEGLAYEKWQVDAKYQTSIQSGEKVALVGVSQFNQLARVLGYRQADVEGAEAKFIPANPYNAKVWDDFRVNVDLKESQLTLQVNGRVHQSVLPSYAFGSNVLLVSDEMFQAVGEPIDADTFIGYNVDDWKKTADLGKRLMESDEPHTNEYLTSFAYEYGFMKQTYGVMLFIGVLVGAVFFIAAGSFLYFRLYTDLEHDQRQYRAISKIGLTDKELEKIITRQLLLLFFVPIAMAIMHSTFAFIALQSTMLYPIATPTMIVLGSFLLVQVMYFLLIRSRYLRHVKAAIA